MVDTYMIIYRYIMALCKARSFYPDTWPSAPFSHSPSSGILSLYGAWNWPWKACVWWKELWRLNLHDDWTSSYTMAFVDCQISFRPVRVWSPLFYNACLRTIGRPSTAKVRSIRQLSLKNLLLNKNGEKMLTPMISPL